jgi:hypothetical protein
MEPISIFYVANTTDIQICEILKLGLKSGKRE